MAEVSRYVGCASFANVGETLRASRFPRPPEAATPRRGHQNRTVNLERHPYSKLNNSKAREAPMPNREIYRQRAEACRAEAAKAMNDDLKRHYEDLAGAWLALAAGPETLEPGLEQPAKR
jgi:hypothetical protein